MNYEQCAELNQASCSRVEKRSSAVERRSSVVVSMLAYHAAGPDSIPGPGG